MIKKLHVNNFAIIDDITLDFKPNMTSLTGQTGAGKSLIIDCISLLLGARADLDMIRYGESKAVIEGYFDYKNFLYVVLLFYLYFLNFPHLEFYFYLLKN